MNSVVGNLFDRAERAGAALLICDDQDRIIKVNKKHAQIYDFVEYASRPTFEEFLWGCINNRKMANPFVYQDPHAWLGASARFRQISNYSQFITYHTDGRVFLVCYEKVKGATNWAYQARIDITQEVKTRIRQDGGLIGPACWEGTFAPLDRNSSVPIINVLNAMPTAAGLIMRRGQLLDANGALVTLLREGDGLSKMDGRVVAWDPAEQAEFLHRLNRFFEPGSLRTPVAMRISRAESEEPYFITVSSLLDPRRETWDNRHIGVLTVANPADTPSIDPRMLVEFLGLTFAEAEVAAALGAGHTTACIAEQKGVQVNTVYAQIKKIIEKTGYKGQADIARRVSDLARIFGSRR
jgi:DNA-binding CsgD family transcriptional regulator